MAADRVPKTEKEPTKYWLSNLPEAISLRQLVATAKLRWRIERDYEELKQELGLGHYEGRNWRGFHHHATLCIAAYGFLVLERCFFPLPQVRRHCGQSTSGFAYPVRNPATRLAALPVRTERHNPSSIATLRARSPPPGPLPAQVSLLPARLLVTQ